MPKRRGRVREHVGRGILSLGPNTKLVMAEDTCSVEHIS